MNLNLIKDFQVTLDLIKIYPNPQIQVKATDLNTIKFSFIVQDNGDKVDLTGTIVRLTVKKPFGLTVIQDCVITDPINGLCEIILTNQAYIEVGNYTGELVITKDTDVTVTRSFEYSSLASILDDDTLQSQNDWQAIHEIMLNNDLRPILGEGNPNTFVSPEYIGQTYLDTLGMVMYYSSTVTNDGWLPFGTGGVESGGGPVYWNDILSKPNAFPPETHTHLWTDITDKPVQFAPTAHQHDWGTGITNKPTEFPPSAHEHTITDVSGLTEALGGIGVPKTGVTDPTGVTPDYIGQIYIDTVAKEAYIANSDIGDWQSISMDELGGSEGSVDWTAITSKPNSFPPDVHTHVTTEITDLQAKLDLKGDLTVVNGKMSKARIITGPPNTAPEHFAQLAVDSTNKKTYMCEGSAVEDWTELAHADHEHTIDEIIDLTTTLNGKSNTNHNHTGVYYSANGGNINGSITISNKGDMVNQLRFNTDRPWTFKQKNADLNAELILTPDANSKIFRIISPLGTDALKVFVDDNATNAYVDMPVIKENGVLISTKYAPAAHVHLWADITDKPTTFTPSAHVHVWADITDKPTTFTPTLATTGILGGIKVGNGLRMGGTGNEWLTLRDGVGIKTNSGTLAVDVDKPTLDGWYAKSTQGLSVWKGTQAEYTAIGTKDPVTLYFITG